MDINEKDMALLKREAAARRIPVEQLLQELEVAQPPVKSPEPAPTQSFAEMPSFEISDDGEDGANVEPELPPFAEEPPTDKSPALGTVTKICPHCGLNPEQTALAVPTSEDKLLFLHCLLGDQLFKKAYPLFGGRLNLAYRMLRTAELDYLWREALQEQRKGRLLTAQDCYDYIANLRVYMQLVSVTARSGIKNVLPDGITRQTCPDAVQTWDELLPRTPDVADELPLVQRIQEYVNNNVLRMEAVLNSARTMCDQFNRVVVVLELNKANDPFWSEIETPP